MPTGKLLGMDAETPEGEDYWNTSTNKAFSFDDQDESYAPENFGRQRLVADDNVSETSFEFPTNEIPLSAIISDEELKQILDEQCFEDNPIRKGISQEDELKILRRKVQDQIHPPPVEVTANKLLLGKRCSLEAYKSLYDKEQLLDEVISTGSGDAILAVVLLLAKTLNRKQLNRLLLTRPPACDQYLNYLTVRMKIAEAMDILTMLGREQEAAMLQFKIAVQMHSDPQIRKQKIKKAYSDHFSQASQSIPLYSQIIGNAINLLEWQLHEKSKSPSSEIDIVGSSPVETLYYVCTKYHWKDNALNDLYNPTKFVSDYQISAAQFEWTALNERARSQAYLDLNGIFEKSSWNIMKQKQFHINIPLEAAIMRLHAWNAPPPVLHSFLSKLSEPSRRLSLSKQVKCTRGIIDALAALKEKQVLEEYKESLAEGSEERFYAENSLRSMNKKWSTEGIKLIKSDKS